MRQSRDSAALLGFAASFTRPRFSPGHAALSQHLDFEAGPCTPPTLVYASKTTLLWCPQDSAQPARYSLTGQDFALQVTLSLAPPRTSWFVGDRVSLLWPGSIRTGLEESN